MAECIAAVYDRVDGLDLNVDVHLPTDPVSGAGALLWFHGGALLLGARSDVPDHLVELAREAGFALVSADYRLAPQADIDEIARDAEAALRWAQTAGAAKFGWAGNSVVVAGASAGGYLALRTGLMSPPPAALVSWFGYGTIDSAWHTEPSAAHFKPAGRINEDEAFASVGHDVVVDGHLRPDAFKYYLYSRQMGQWPALAAGVDCPSERHRLRRHSPTYHVTNSFPPTLLLHGTVDHDVPHTESAAMAAMLALHNVDHEFISLDGFDHGLDPGNDPVRENLIAEATRRAEEFIKLHVHAA